MTEVIDEKFEEIPEWMTNEFFQNILQIERAPDDEIIVKDFNVSLATKKGNNFASTIYRISINANENQKDSKKSLIVKVTPSDDEKRLEIIKKSNIFVREIKMYSEILPQIHTFLGLMGDNIKISPKYFYTTNDPKFMLIFEDLLELGYKTKNFQMGLDLEESLYVLEKLAKFHACSAYLYAVNPESMDEFLEGSITENPQLNEFMEFYRISARMIKQTLESIGGFENLTQKLENFDEKFIQKELKVYSRNSNTFNVLNHNDLWINNLMFRYSEKRDLESVLMLDFQLSYWGSPGIDLNYFFYGTIRDDVRNKYFKFLIKHYHEILSKTLKALKYKNTYPSVQDIHIELIKTGFHAVNAAICLRPFCAMGAHEDASMALFLDQTQKGSDYRQKLFMNPLYLAFLKTVIIEFDIMGYFD